MENRLYKASSNCVRVSSLFSAFFVRKKFEIINFEWLNTKLLELIHIVSSDCRTDSFSYSFAFVYSAELTISSNGHSSLVTCQMPLSRAVLLVTRDPSKLFGVPSLYLN